MIYKMKLLKQHIILLTLMLVSASLIAQDRVSVEGNVYAAKDKSPLKDIQVEVVGEAGVSVATNESGEFKIDANSSKVKLRFYYPGYITQEKYSAGKMEVYLYKEGESLLDEMFSLAHTSNSQRNLSVAAENVDISTESQSAVNSIDELLKTSSAQTTVMSGTPGEGAVVNIRGYSSVFANTKPLVVVDGLLLENYSFEEGAINGLYHNPLFNIDPRDVESITILKDAAATAIYGAKGANGVIIVNTNAVGVGETSIDISAFGGVNMVPVQHMPVMMSQESSKSYLQGQLYGMGLSASAIDGKYPYFREDTEDPVYHAYNNKTDWQEQIYDMGINTGFHASMKGGDEIAKYYFSGGFKRNEGNVSNVVTNRFNLRLNAEVNISPKMTADVNMGFSYSDGNYLEQGDVINTNPLHASRVKAPFMGIYAFTSSGIELPITADEDIMGFSNPSEVINKTNASRSVYNFTGNMNFKYNITSSLTANALVGTEISKVWDAVFLPDWGIGNNGDFAARQVIKNYTGKISNTYVEGKLSYNKTFNTVHNLYANIGLRVGATDVNSIFGAGRNTASDEFTDLDGVSGRENRYGYHQLWRDYAYFAGLTYNYMEKYYLNASASIDASSRFGVDVDETVLGTPAAKSKALGLAWDISNEDFLANSSIVDLFKVRASFGTTANSGIGAYAAKHYYTGVQYYRTSGLVRGNTPNEKLKWEENIKRNLGVDISLFRNKLTLTADIYGNTTHNMLSYIIPPYEYGFDKFWLNNKELGTKGYELSASITPVNKDFSWTLGGTIGSYKMKMDGFQGGEFVLDVAGGQKIFADDAAPGLFYGYKTNGVIASQAEADALGLTSNGAAFEAGDMKFSDLNGDKIINEDDRMVIGDPTPDFYGSVTSTMKYKRVSFEAVASFVEGVDVYNQPRRIMESMSGLENQSTVVERRWQVDGQVTDIPKASYGDPMGNARFSDRWIEDGSYVRLSRVSLSLDISQWIKSSNKASIYVSGLNLFTLTDYLGPDPEFSYGHSMLWNGIDYGKFPHYGTIMAGLKIEL
jgi:TonB-linked SusC/RagA family outer membrane protein